MPRNRVGAKLQLPHPCHYHIRGCSRCVVSLVTSAVYGAVLWHCMFSQLGIRLWPVHSLSPATSGIYEHGCAQHCGHAPWLLQLAPRWHVRDNLRKLQVTKNALAEVVCQAVRTCSATEPHHTLHWLPVKQRIDYKLVVLTYKATQTGSPSYLACLVSDYAPSRSLRRLQPSLHVSRHGW